MNNVLIREASVADIPAMLQLYAQPGYDDGETLPFADAQKLFEKTAAYPFYKFFVALEGGAVAGTYAILVMDNIGHCGAPSALVESVVVDPSIQGRGIGQAMMDHAMTIAKEKGCYKLSLSSSVKRDRAHAFYEKLGYRRYGYSFGVDLHPVSAP